MKELINAPTLAADLGDSLWVDPLDFGYMAKLTKREWRHAKLLAKQSMDSVAGTGVSDYMRSYGPVEKAGEYIVNRFLNYYCTVPYDTDFFSCDPQIPSFSVAGLTIDVHTRMLKLDAQARKFGKDGRLINLSNFLLMVPEVMLTRRADIYIFCGFDVESLEGYAFGWVTSERLAAVDVTTDVKHPAKCFLIPQIYPMQHLLDII